MRIWEETADSPEYMQRRGYRLLDSGPLEEELSTWRDLLAQDHFIYDTAHEQVTLTLYGGHFYAWVPEEEPGEASEKLQKIMAQLERLDDADLLFLGGHTQALIAQRERQALEPIPVMEGRQPEAP